MSLKNTVLNRREKTMRNPKRRRTNAHPHDSNDKGAKHKKPSSNKNLMKHEENPVMRADEILRILPIGKNTFYTLIVGH